MAFFQRFQRRSLSKLNRTLPVPTPPEPSHRLLGVPRHFQVTTWQRWQADCRWRCWGLHDNFSDDHPSDHLEERLRCLPNTTGAVGEKIGDHSQLLLALIMITQTLVWGWLSIIWAGRGFVQPTALQWRHNRHDSVSNHQPHDCLLNRLFRRRSKENINAPRHWPFCGEFTGTGEFPAQSASYAENVSIRWRHHEIYRSCKWPDTTQANTILYQTVDETVHFEQYSLI